MHPSSGQVNTLLQSSAHDDSTISLLLTSILQDAVASCSWHDVDEESTFVCVSMGGDVNVTLDRDLWVILGITQFELIPAVS